MKPHFLIVDSGSTKADWLFVEINKEEKITTEGINVTVLANIDSISLDRRILSRIPLVNEVFFYGAGVISELHLVDLKRLLVKNGLRENIVVRVESDLLAAIRGTLGDKDGVVSILGTGSNTGIQNRQEISVHNPSLGYMISDEGSGVAIGKKLLKEYFYNRMPSDVQKEFDLKYELERSAVLKNLYRLPKPNAYLASFSPFVLESIHEEWRESFMKSVFKDYVHERLLTIKDYNTYDLHFVGSIAYFYRSYLEMTLSEFDLTAKSIIKSPLEGLANYHKRKEN